MTFGVAAHHVAKLIKEVVMSQLKKFTDAELQKELETRKTKKNSIPKMLDAKNLTKRLQTLQHMVEHYVKQVAENGGDEDDQHYIYEAAVELFYGNKVWDWINNNTC